jgi:hypothetical protein
MMIAKKPIIMCLKLNNSCWVISITCSLWRLYISCMWYCGPFIKVKSIASFFLGGGGGGGILFGFPF